MAIHLEPNEKLKSVGSTLDFGFDWKSDGWLAEEEEIASHEITYVDDRLTLTNDYAIDGKVVFYVSGGEVGKWHEVRCQITTNATPRARVDERTLRIYVTQR